MSDHSNHPLNFKLCITIHDSASHDGRVACLPEVLSKDIRLTGLIHFFLKKDACLNEPGRVTIQKSSRLDKKVLARA